MAKILQSIILFKNEPWAVVSVEYPFTKVHIKGISPGFNGSHIPHHFYAMIDNDVEQPKLIQMDEDPLNYVAYLYQGITGSYYRATEAKVMEEDSIVQKQKENDDDVDLNIPNLDYAYTLEWLHKDR